MAQRTVGIIINGATGRMGGIHLKGLLDIRAEGGLPLKNGDRLVPDPLLVGRNPATLKALADTHGGLRWTTDVGAAIAGPDAIFMDCAATGGRADLVRRAIAAQKHIHIEKPTAGSVEEALDLARRAQRAGVKHGVIQDKLHLPGFAKLMDLKQAG